MKSLAVLFCLLALSARAHVGSPNVFFEGHAGPHAVRVVIRPPATVPGIAQVDVRAGVTGVTLQAAPWETGDNAAAEPVRAMPVAGEAGLFHAPLWLLARGSYRVRVSVESERGGGVVSVPLLSAAIQRPTMPPALGALLAILGAALFVSAVAIAGAAAPTHRRNATAIATLLLTGAVAAGAWRWRTMDREFSTHGLSRPLPVEASVRTAGSLHLLRLSQPADSTEPAWDSLVTDHGKLMHLFLCREPDARTFAHLHPVRRDGATFENVLPALPAGSYQLYAEITYENGLSQTLVSRVAVPEALATSPPMAAWKMANEVWCQTPAIPLGNAAQPVALDADDSWHSAEPAPSPAARALVCPLADGSHMVFLNAGDLVADRETSLRFAVFTAAGRRAALQTYMGMAGHAVVRRADGAVFTHLHPGGTISMAAQQMLAEREGPLIVPLATSTDEVTFPYAFPRAGEYRVWMQVRLDGRVQTGVFEVTVRPEP